jgi:dihydroneopterin aldolase
MHRIELTGIECQARIGVPDLERRQAQRILVDIVLDLDLTRAALADDFHATVDYEQVVGLVHTVVDSRPWSLIESLSLAVARLLLAETGAARVTVRVIKFPLSLQGRVRQVSAEITLTGEDCGAGGPGLPD